jgi:hypothetical protein
MPAIFYLALGWQYRRDAATGTERWRVPFKQFV